MADRLTRCPECGTTAETLFDLIQILLSEELDVAIAHRGDLGGDQ